MSLHLEVVSRNTRWACREKTADSPVKHLWRPGARRQRRPPLPLKAWLSGENPPKPAIHSEIRRQATAAGLGVWINSVLAIAYQESTFHQFIDYVSVARPDEGFPFKGALKGEDSTD